MAESGQEANPQTAAENKETSAATFPQFSIWPPSQRTRDAVIQRLVETLTSPSVLSKRYGVLQPDEASVTAQLIESEAFAAAGAGAAVTGDTIEEGIAVLQIYSKEISKRVLDSAKARAGLPPSSNSAAGDESAPATPSADANAVEVAPPPSEYAGSTVGVSEDVTSLESETLTA